MTQVSAIGTAGNLGMYCGFTMGAFFDRFGPARTAALAGALSTTGYVLCALLVHARSQAVWLYALLFFCIGQGNHAFYSTGLMGNVANFAASRRGLVTGVLVAAFGVSSALYATLYHTVFDPNVSNFFFFCAASMAASACCGVAFVRQMPVESAAESERQGAVDIHGRALVADRSFQLLFVVLLIIDVRRVCNEERRR